jgi:hypothetical protein
MVSCTLTQTRERARARERERERERARARDSEREIVRKSEYPRRVSMVSSSLRLGQESSTIKILY